MPGARQVTIVAGPTASGKSAYALNLAHEQHGLVINADALQIYDALPILTAQPSPAEQAQAPHALYGILPPSATSNVIDWVTRCVEAIQNAWAQGLHPIVVGGTGLYLKSLQYGLSPLPPVPDTVRAQSRALQEQLGNPAFHQVLAQLDPIMGQKLNPNDTQRLIRAHEVFVATGKSLKAWQEMPPIPPLPDTMFTRVLIDGDRDALRARALRRLHQMVDMGVVDEVAAFAQLMVDSGLDPTCAPTHALGYHAFCALARQDLDLDDAIKSAAVETGQYIKRQQTWLRHQMSFDTVINIA